MEAYPVKIVCYSLLYTITVFILGVILLSYLDSLVLLFYILTWIVVNVLSLKLRCSYCYYYGKRCSGGLGKISALFWSQGSPQEFMNPRNTIPILLLSIVTLYTPVVGGFLVVIHYALMRDGLLAVIGFLYITYLVVGLLLPRLTQKKICNQCVQGKLGCPFYEHMMKSSKS